MYRLCAHTSRLFRGSPHEQQTYTMLHVKELTFQMLAFNAATGNAFTIFLAGFAFTMTTFPNTSRFPALVAGFVRIFKRAKPGTVNTPVFFTSHAVANASAIPPLDMALTAAFAFIGAMTMHTERMKTATPNMICSLEAK